MLKFLLLTLSLVSAKPLRLSLNWKPEPQFGGFYQAEQAGLFKKAKLDVAILPGGSGTPTVQMLMAGKTEYAVVSADELVVARDHGGTDLIAIFAVFQTNPQCLMSHAEKKYTQLSDMLADEKALLLWQAGLPYAQFLKKKPMHIRTAPYMGGISTFIHGPEVTQQCFAASEPLAARRQGLKVKVFMIADAGYNPYTTVLATRRSNLKEHPAEVKQMVATVRQGWSEYLHDPVPANRFMMTLNPAMDARTFSEGAKAQELLVRTAETGKDHLGIMSEARWKALVEQLHDLQVIHSTPPATELFENP